MSSPCQVISPAIVASVSEAFEIESLAVCGSKTGGLTNHTGGHQATSAWRPGLA